MNIPDGEVFHCTREGFRQWCDFITTRLRCIEDIPLIIFALNSKMGKSFIGCTADQGAEFLDEIFDTDEGAQICW